LVLFVYFYFIFFEKKKVLARSHPLSPPLPPSSKPQSTPTVSGYFEVTVNGTLVHSKNNGDGFPREQEKIDKIVAAIEAALNGG